MAAERRVKKNAFPFRESVLLPSGASVKARSMNAEPGSWSGCASAHGKLRAGGQAVLRAGRQAVADCGQRGNTQHDGNDFGHIVSQLGDG